MSARSAMLMDMTHALLGSRSISMRPGVRFEEAPGRLRLVAERDLTGIATGRFDQPAGYVAYRPRDAPSADRARFGGYSFTQFGLPVAADASLDFRFGTGQLVSPSVMLPCFAFAEGEGACLLAPLDAFHEQVIAVVDGELRWGWHGDLDEVPAGFSTELELYEGESIRELLSLWGQALRERSGVAGADRYADVSTSHLSYWTDNGAAYWYRREAGRDLSSTLEEKCRELREQDVPIRSVELDSWFYPHEKSRPIQEVGYLDTVPPTGMLRWEPRNDVLPEGVGGLRARLGDPPLILHSRHISARSPYLEDDEDAWWVHHGLAHPRDADFFERWLRDAAKWGATCYEQDWMWVTWFGMRPLRAGPGRARAWQHGLDRAAATHDLGLIWCMATPADFALATQLPRVVAIRTCDDYRYADDPAFLWSWFLVVNAMASGLGLWPFKDVFFSARGEDIDGDPHPEIEALLSALSAGPVGIGDRLGRTDPALVLRTCRADGLLVKPDRPIAALDAGLLGGPQRGEGLLFADTYSGDTRYVLALHVADEKGSLRDGLDLDEASLIYDWRTASAREGRRIEVELSPREHAYWVIAPIRDGAALIGDVGCFATMGDRRIQRVDARRAEVLGVPGERVTVRWWTRESGLVDTAALIPESGRTTVKLD